LHFCIFIVFSFTSIGQAPDAAANWLLLSQLGQENLQRQLSGPFQADAAHSPFSLGQIHDFGDDRPILCFLVFDTFELSVRGRTPAVPRFFEFSSFALMERFVFNSREIVLWVLALTAA
jgi:hypothetical protein